MRRSRRLGKFLVPVLLGALLTTLVIHGAISFGGAAVGIFLVVATLIPWLSEASGVRFAFPFGRYKYTDKIGSLRLLGVPPAVMIAWPMIIYFSNITAPVTLIALARLASIELSRLSANPFSGPVISIVNLLLVPLYCMIADLFLEPLMVRNLYWNWDVRYPERNLLSRLLGSPYKRIPFINYLGWFFTGLVANLTAHYVADGFALVPESFPVWFTGLPLLWCCIALVYLSESIRFSGLRRFGKVTQIVGLLFGGLYLVFIVRS